MLLVSCEDRNRNQSPQKKSQFYRQSRQEEEEKKPKGAAGHANEYGNPDYVCFKIGRLEFFTKASAFARHSQYFSKMQGNIQIQHDAEEHKAEEELRQQQIVVKLPKTTLPSALLLVVQYIEDKYILDATIDLQTAFEFAKISDWLKMRKLESELLCDISMQLINKHNVIHYLNTCHNNAIDKRNQYRGEAVMVPPSDSESERSEKDKKGRRDKRKNDKRSRSESDSGSMSESSSSCDDDISQSESEESKRAPRMVQMDIPFDKNEIIEELKESEENWKELSDYCVALAANNLNFIMEKQVDELVGQVKSEIIEQVIEKHLQFFRADPSHDNRSLIDLLKRVKNCRSVFELLKLEKERIMQEQRQELHDIINCHVIRKPILTWSVSKLNNYFYKQSNSIQIEGANWRLALSYFRKQSTCLKVDIKMMNSPFNTKLAKEYYGKQSLGVPANLDVQKIDPMAQFEVEEVDIELQQQRVNQLNATAARFTNHAFVSFAATVDLFQDEPLNLPAIHSIICSQKQPVQLISVKDFDIAQLDGGPVNVSLKFRLKEMHSQLLSYISKNFTFLMHEPEIRFLSKDDFKLLLRHKYLNVTQEDEVLKAISLWLEGQTLMLKRSKYANVPKASLNMVQGPNADEFSSSDASSDLEMEHKDGPLVAKQNKVETSGDLVNDLNEILGNVNWDFVSLPCMLDILRTEALFRKCNAFRSALKTQFTVRLNSQSKSARDAAHSQFNNEPRFSYKFNMSQRNLYTGSDADRIVAKPGTKSQFQLLYPVEVYPDFMAHLVDCMINPMDIVNNWSLQSLQNSNMFQGHQGKGQLKSIGTQNSVDDVRLQAESQQAVKKRLLQQQLLKKKLEMKHIQDQLQAMDLLDNLHNQKNSEGRFGKLNADIEKAKRLFKMRLDNQAKKPHDRQQEKGSGRMHIGKESNGSVSDDAGVQPESSSSQDSRDDVAEDIEDKSGQEQQHQRRRHVSESVQAELMKNNAPQQQESVESPQLVLKVSQREAQSICSYQELRAERNDWSKSSGQVSQASGSSESARLPLEKAPHLHQNFESSRQVSCFMKQDVVNANDQKQQNSQVINSYRYSSESNEDQLPYNSSIESIDLVRIPLSDPLGSKQIQLKSDVDRYLKGIQKFPSQQHSMTTINTLDKKNNDKETQTRNPLFCREAQAQTEIDMDFMIQLQDQLRRQMDLEKQLYSASQMIKWAEMKNENEKNKAQLVQEQAMSLEILKEESIAPDAIVLEVTAEPMYPDDLNKSKSEQQQQQEQQLLESIECDAVSNELMKELPKATSENGQAEEPLPSQRTSEPSEKVVATIVEEVSIGEELQLDAGHINDVDQPETQDSALQINNQLPEVQRILPQDDDLEVDESQELEQSVSDESDQDSKGLSESDQLSYAKADEINEHLPLLLLEDSKAAAMRASPAKVRGRKQAAQKRKVNARRKSIVDQAKRPSVKEKGVRVAKIISGNIKQPEAVNKFKSSGARFTKIEQNISSSLIHTASMENKKIGDLDYKHAQMTKTVQQSKLEKFINKHAGPSMPHTPKQVKHFSSAQKLVKKAKTPHKPHNLKKSKVAVAIPEAVEENNLLLKPLQDEELSDSLNWRYDSDRFQQAQDAQPILQIKLNEAQKVAEIMPIEDAGSIDGLVVHNQTELRKSQTFNQIQKLIAVGEVHEVQIRNAMRTVPDVAKDESEGVKLGEDRDGGENGGSQSTPLDQNHPLFVDNSSEIYQDVGEGLPSGSSESEPQSQSSHSESTPLSKSDYFTSREAGLACFNILDHLRQSKEQSMSANEPSEENKDSSHGRIQLEELRENHIQMKIQQRAAKKIRAAAQNSDGEDSL